ncbi:MAG: peptidylprolyl isomerase [Labilithrix sp.]|nr:peptidylprolyl isomerase [Labilithrix sp.]MCW5809762.1 peptidylprolyl isomerase [Labilithrix sp.]
MRIVARSLVVALFGLAAALAPTSASAFPQSTHPAMKDPSKATEKAPDSFRAKFTTTKGDIVFECTRSWAPNGVDRFYNLVKIGFFDDVALFRVAKGFVVQWGIHGDPQVSKVWSDANLPPDPVVESNKRGMLTYAMAGRPDTRSTQLFINYKDNVGLDGQGFAPICKVVEGMETADAFNGEYGEQVTGKQGEIQSKGNAYLHEAWPNLDYIKTAVITGDGAAPSTPKSDTGGSSQESPGIMPFVLGAIVLAAALYFLMGRKSPPEPAKEPPATPKKKKKAKTDDKSTKE